MCNQGLATETVVAAGIDRLLPWARYGRRLNLDPIDVATVFEKKSYRSIGYKTWKEYVEDGLGYSRSHGYNLVAMGKATRLLRSAGILPCPTCGRPA